MASFVIKAEFHESFLRAKNEGSASYLCRPLTDEKVTIHNIPDIIDVNN